MIKNINGKISFSLLGLVIVLLIIVPLALPTDWVSIFNEILIIALAGSALNLMMGYGGMVSFGPAALYAVGAYTTALLLKSFHAPFVLSIVLSPVVAAIIGLIVGWFCIRRSAVYFVLLTLAFGQIIWTIIFKWYDFTKGDDGIVNIPIPEFLTSMTNVYYFSLVVVLICLYLLWRIVHSPFGLTIQAIRENALRTEFIAVPVKHYQLAVFVLASAFLGIAGSLYCLFAGSVFPDYAHWAKSADIIIVCLLGGIYNFAGPIVGSFVYIMLSKLIAQHTIYWMFFLGFAVLILVLFLRNGIAGFLMDKMSHWKKSADENISEGRS